MNTTTAPAEYDDNAMIERVEDRVAAKVEGQVVVMNLDDGNFYELNRVATRIWEQLEAPMSVEGLYAKLDQIFDVSPDQCRTEVSRFLGEMSASGLIRVVPQA